MKIKNIAIIILMTIFLIIFGIKLEATTGIINEDAAKLRKEPESKTVLDLLNKGDEVEVLEEKNGWYKVKATTSLGKVTGYVDSDELEVYNGNISESEEEPVEIPSESPKESQSSQEETPLVSENIEENKEYILVQEIGIKAVPLMSSKEKAQISGTINVIETINDWSRIENETEIGWVRTRILEKTLTEIKKSEQEENVQKDSEVNSKLENGEIELDKVGYVNADGLRVRTGPSTDTEELTSLGRNYKVKIIGQIGNWYKIELNEKIGYVSAKYISDTKSSETTSRGGSSLKNETIVNEETSIVTEMQQVQEDTHEETIGLEIVEFAKKYLGYKYVSGGASPSTGFDCSGFTTYVYKQFGISLYRTSKEQIKNGVAVEKNDLQPGDIVIFNNDANTAIGHVGIYIGDGNFIHASNPSDGVKITTLSSGYYNIRYVGARRVI